MKIFGYEFWKKEKVEIIKDKVPEIKMTLPNINKPSLLGPLPDPSLKYYSTRGSGRGSFYPAEYDLSEIGRIEDTDGYVRQSFNKKVALMFKEGYDLVGPTPAVIKYINSRLGQIARASKTPTQQMFRDIGSSLIRKSNAFIIKVRKTKASGGAVRRELGSKRSIQPVAGYFVAPAETMEYEVSGNKITKWRQKMPDGQFKEFAPSDVIHFYHDKKDGFVFGTPIIIPVIDDIRALRKIEENIELLVYQHLFPLFQYKVGTEDMPASISESGEREIDVVRREIQFMPTEGGIVTPERHEITAIGAEGRALRAEGYLEHFKKRVFAGLGISAVDLGEGETANRATADNMSRNLIDSVKNYQQIMEIFLNEEIVAELLLESTFGEDVLEKENRCFFKFKEIDLDQQIKREAHIVDQFNKHAVTWDDVRTRMGYEPILVPSPEEVEAGTDTPERYPEWNNTYWKLFRMPELLIQSLDEPWSIAARAAAGDNSLPFTEKGNKESGKEKKEYEVTLERERAKAKQQMKPKVTKKDSYLSSVFLQTKKDIADLVFKEQSFDEDWSKSIIRTQLSTSTERLLVDQMLAFFNGYMSESISGSDNYIEAAIIARRLFRDRSEHYINKLIRNVNSSLSRNTKDLVVPTEIISRTNAVFEALQYRTSFIEDVEIRKAHNFGVLVGAKEKGYNSVNSIISDESTCAICLAASKKSIQLDYLTLDDFPPHHSGCECSLTLEEPEPLIKDSKLDPSESIEDEDIAKCPECGKTAIRKIDTSDTFNCRACKTSFTFNGDRIDR